MSDTRRVDVTADSNEELKLALQLLWPDQPIIGYQVFQPEPDHHTESLKPATLILYAEYHKGMTLCAYGMDFENTLHFIMGWLQVAAYPEDDEDNIGIRLPGWRLFCDRGGAVLGHEQACMGLQPVWSYYSK